MDVLPYMYMKAAHSEPQLMLREIRQASDALPSSGWALSFMSVWAKLDEDEHSGGTPKSGNVTEHVTPPEITHISYLLVNYLLYCS